MNAPTKSPPVTFAEAFVKLQGEIKPAVKDATNPAFRSKYADLSAVWEAVRGPLADNGFGVIQAPQFEGETMFLETTLLHASGDRMVSRYPLRPMKHDPQGYGSAITYAKRYALSAMLGVVADDDDDGNAASGNGKPAASKPSTLSTSEPLYDEDPDGQCKAWCDKEIGKFNALTRLPDLLMWQDEREAELHRLLGKSPKMHRYLMDAFQAKQAQLSKKTEKA